MGVSKRKKWWWKIMVKVSFAFYLAPSICPDVLDRLLLS